MTSLIELAPSKEAPNSRPQCIHIYNYDEKLVAKVTCLENQPKDLPSVLIMRKDFLKIPQMDIDLMKRLPNLKFQVDGTHETSVREWGAVLKILFEWARIAVLDCDKYMVGLYYTGGNPTQDVLTPIDAYCGILPKGLPIKAPSFAVPLTSGPPTPGIHPSYLDSLVHTHSSWVFGGIAELIDNARDANATKLEIFVTHSQKMGEITKFPALCVRDNGSGMTQDHILRMFSLGHEQSQDVDTNQIGRFGVGFKTGSLRVGSDVLVLTQSKDEERNMLSQSIGFMSRSFNAGRQALELPILNYLGDSTESLRLDETSASKQKAEEVLESISNLTGFNKSRISDEFKIMEKNSEAEPGQLPHGTAIFIFNLKRDKGRYELDWESHEGDIITRSRRPRSRPGQMATEVPLDLSLAEYVRFIFLDPRMSIHVQNKRVRSQQLVRLFSQPKQSTPATILGQSVKLKMGFVESEKERGGCGIFLYWHGRLIEAYKRVGRMLHDQDCGLGVIGVIEVSRLMDGDKEGGVKVLNSKQGFEDCEAYAQLEQWLGNEFNTYWDKHFDKYRNELEPLSRVEENVVLTPDVSYAQCDRCTKWRTLPEDVTPEQLPDTWFCWMEPFKQGCSVAEEPTPGEDEVVTVQIGRNKCVPSSPLRPLPASSSVGGLRSKGAAREGPIPRSRLGLPSKVEGDPRKRVLGEQDQAAQKRSRREEI